MDKSDMKKYTKYQMPALNADTNKNYKTYMDGNNSLIHSYFYLN